MCRRVLSRALGGRLPRCFRASPRLIVNRESSAGSGSKTVNHPRSLLDEVDRKIREREAQKSDLTDIETAKIIPETPASSSSSDSFFEVFAIPKSEPRHPDSFDAEACQTYQDIITPFIETDPKIFRRLHTSKPISLEETQPVIDWLREERHIVDISLPAFEDVLRRNGAADTSTSRIDTEMDRETLREQVKAQHTTFCKQRGFNTVQSDMLQRALFRATSQCAKLATGKPVPVLWEKIKEAGILDKTILHTLLYVSSTFSLPSGSKQKHAPYARLVRSSSILDALDAQPENNASIPEAEDNHMDTTDEIAVFHDLLLKPTEQSVNIRVRMLVALGNAKEAEELLNNHAGTIEIRLRAYTPILRLYLELGDISAALALYKRMESMPLVHFDVDTYVHLLAGLSEKHCFTHNAPEISGCKELGYSVGSGPQLFDEIATEMSREILEIPMVAAKRLYNALAAGFPDKELEVTSSMTPLKLSEEEARENELIASRVRIDPQTGLCPRSGASLRLIHLADSEREQLKRSILELARSSQTKFEQKHKIRRTKHVKSVRADEGLETFLQALDSREGEPFTAIVDGPNVGYYMQNFDGGRFSFHQIQFVVDSLESMGERPLVVLPQKYTRNHFHVTIGFVEGKMPQRQAMTAEETRIRDGLIRSGKIYIVPQGFLDDFYWILASIADQTRACKGDNLYVPPGNAEGRWPGARPILVSNDKMRDHKIGMLEPMLFRRWFSNFIVNYNFASFVNGKCSHPDIGFQSANVFSREIQGNTTSAGALAWHFPLEDADEEWFCIRIPARNV